ncbi:hypothetical protein CDD83_7548 [Cordyceps sp. RAO-2017]|nr:hypothetical protein CDD83_7548 [Cordyceps sp. RAO-2017]
MNHDLPGVDGGRSPLPQEHSLSSILSRLDAPEQLAESAQDRTDFEGHRWLDAGCPRGRRRPPPSRQMSKPPSRVWFRRPRIKSILSPPTLVFLAASAAHSQAIELDGQFLTASLHKGAVFWVTPQSDSAGTRALPKAGYGITRLHKSFFNTPV